MHIGTVYQASADEIADLKQQLKEREDKEIKLKQLALKAKKESSEFKCKVSDMTGLCLYDLRSCH